MQFTMPSRSKPEMTAEFSDNRIRLLRVQLDKNMYRFYPRKYGESFRHRNVVRVYSTIHLVNFSAESCSLD